MSHQNSENKLANVLQSLKSELFSWFYALFVKKASQNSTEMLFYLCLLPYVRNEHGRKEIYV
jgi:hypothetical protein